MEATLFNIAQCRKGTGMSAILFELQDVAKYCNITVEDLLSNIDLFFGSNFTKGIPENIAQQCIQGYI
jgi:hypothetical protein